MQRTAIIAAATAALLATTAAAPAFAQAWQVGADSYHLYLNDLDLGSVAGRAEALARIEKVAAKLCAGKGVRSDERECIAQTMRASVQRSSLPAIKLAQDERAAPSLVVADRR